ncbi:MAG: biotin/lipoyl-binding protein [Inquilinus sp.]|uniref:biotin/lipoyl-binding protein n=1 Tax=Inquilinus sp. TaxID=1932117 RepID=UPI003F37FEDB
MDGSNAGQTPRQTDPSAAATSPAGEAPGLQPVARAQPRPAAPVGEPVTSGRRKPAFRWILAGAKGLATLAIALVAIVMALVTWSTYVTAPWTRDGTMRVQVASVAPQVSGQITELRVGDNQYVHKGDVLYVIDPFDFQVALRTGQALQQESAANLQVKQAESERRQRLTSLATTPEEQQSFAGSAVGAKAAFDAAQQQVAQAEINLHRTQVLSPVNGYVTNLLMRVGDYAHQGEANISVIDTDSYWIDGYFEETKMARVCVGDRVEAKLMGYAEPILGHVATVTRGIGVSNAAAGAQGLPNVDPVYTWVRLAQRVPVRIAIDSVPPGIPLVSGMTATVAVEDPAGSDGGSWLGRTVAEVETRLSDVLNGPSARPGCIPAVAAGRATTEFLPVDTEEPPPSPEQINPGLTPGLKASPTNIDGHQAP